MLFNSFEFILIFLPLICLLFNLTPKRQQYPALILTIGSLCFYAYHSFYNLSIMLVSILFNFFIGKRVPNNKKWLTFGIISNLLLIAFFKYSYFIVSNINSLLTTPINFSQIALPLGISFFTFQQIAYLVDTYHEGKPEQQFVPYALLVSFFPHSIAGPLVQYKEISPQIANVNITRANLTLGLSIFILGLFKKIIIADGIAPCASAVFSAAEHGISPSFAEAWMAAICYSLQLYFDFSGYSDMAVGLAKVFNIQFPMNFNSPYKATSIIDFWRRWHITLSTFLRNYIYIPLGGNRNGSWNRHINLFITMLLGGLWHGANWTFVLWGGAHGLLLIINHAWRNIVNKIQAPKILGSFFPVFGWGITIFCVISLWVLFKSQSLNAAICIYKSMFCFNGISLPLALQKFTSFIHNVDYRGFFYNQFFNMHEYIYLISSAIIIALLGKNTTDFFKTYLNYQSNNFSISSSSKTLSWNPTTIYALAFATLSAWILLVLLSARKLEFLYFDF